jgi:hypothetical protein
LGARHSPQQAEIALDQNEREMDVESETGEGVAEVGVRLGVREGEESKVEEVSCQQF